MHFHWSIDSGAKSDIRLAARRRLCYLHECVARITIQVLCARKALDRREGNLVKDTVKPKPA